MNRSTLAANTIDEYADRTGECWVWLNRPTRHGYGRIRIGDVEHAAHRVVYELLVGPIPQGLTIDHLCRVRNCVNPDHLEPVTAAENKRRGAATITHCPQGHPYDEHNTYRRRGTGWRDCRTCLRLRMRTLRGAS